MGRPRKPEPEKHCEACGKWMERRREKDGDLESLLHFGRRKFCDQKCMAAGFRGRFQEGVLPAEGRYRARSLYTALKCEKCGETRNVDLHHKDENPLNNAAENIQTLCRRCHYWTHNAAKPCSVETCARKRRRYGYCEMHAQRFKKWGDPLAVKVNQHRPVIRMDQ